MTSPTTRLRIHPDADLVPEMRPEEYADLLADIRARGIKTPLDVDGKVVLDGRHRLRAAKELRLKVVPVRKVNLDGETATSFILKAALLRRHLTASQRGLVAARLAPLRAGQRKATSGSGIPLAQPEAASMLNVSVDTVKQARKVIEHGGVDLIRAVERGELAVDAAVPIAQLPKAAQKSVVSTKDPRRRKQLIKDAKVQAREQQQQKREAQEGIGQKSYSVAEWERLSPADKARIIDAGFEDTSQLNVQSSDSIEWARQSLNTVTGCLHPCSYCYARDIANRFYPQKFKPTFFPARLAAPAREQVPSEAAEDPAHRNIFANSMSDLFGAWVPKDWIDATIEMARRNPQWNFLVLTKFPGRACKFAFPPNWWMGTTVDAQELVGPAEKAFAKIQCDTKWLSVEPLLQPLTFSRLDLFQWIVIGGASKSTNTPAWVPPFDWVVNLHQAAREAGLRVYYKTNCGFQDEFRVREFPWVAPSTKRLPRSMQYSRALRVA